MSVRVFISHRQSDSDMALLVAKYLERCGVPHYLDVLDPKIEDQPQELTAHLHEQIKRSTHLMAIVSRATQLSWWVPFEIGLATECGNTICSYLLQSVSLPEYLIAWPYLQSISDLDKYVEQLLASNMLSESFVRKDRYLRRSEAQVFHRQLKQRLGQ